MASVSYRINGKYDGKAVKTAKSDFKSLGDSLRGVATVVKGLAVVKALQEINKFANATKEVFVQQNKALTNFNTAVKKSGLEIQKLTNIQSKLSKNNFFDADSLNNATAMAVNMGLTEKQIEDVMKAATDLAASGVMPLDQATKSLALTYSGTAGTLGKTIPQLKNLTKEQLANGDAVKLVAEQYKGYADAMSNTFSGRNTQWKNSMDDLKAAIGGIPAALSFLTEGKLLEPLNKITQWIVDNRNNIIQFFIAIPELAKTSLDGIMEMVRQTFTGAGMSNLFSFLGEMLITSFSSSITMIQGLFKLMINNIKLLFENLVNGNLLRIFGNLVANIGNKFIETINKLIEKMIQDHPNISKILGLEGKEIKFRFKTDLGQDLDAVTNGLKDNAQQFIKDYKKAMEQNFKGSADALKKFSAYYNPDELADKLKNVLDNTTLPDDLKLALEGMTLASENINPTTTTTNGDGETEQSKTNDLLQSVLNSTGEIGGLISAVMSGGKTGAIVFVLTKILDAISSASEIVSNVLNFISYMIQTILPPLIALFENLLAPILPFLTVIAEMLKDLFTVIEPFISFMVSNVVKGILAVIVLVLDMIYNVVVAIHNFFSKNNWAYRDVFSDVSSIMTAGTKPATGSSELVTSNASASYGAARDIYVNINYNHSYVNGDAREIAIGLYNELKMAQAMGY